MDSPVPPPARRPRYETGLGRAKPDAGQELLVEVKVALAEAIRELREVRSLSQADLARLIGSGQARVSKLERSLESTSLDTLFRCMLALEASRQDLAKTVGRSPAR